MAEYEIAYAPDKLEDLMLAVINKHHPHLQGFNIKLCMFPKSWKAHGRIVLAKAKAGTTRERVLLGVDGWIDIAEELWDIRPALLSPELQQAVLDHELSHFEVKETAIEDVMKLATVPHDIEDFLAIIRRHGLYKEELRALGVVMQDTLPLEEKEGEQ